MKKIVMIRVEKASKKQKDLWGQTEFVNEGLNIVWLREGQKDKQLVDTYFHEMTHVFLGLVKRTHKLTNEQEEALCRMVGQTASTILTRGGSK